MRAKEILRELREYMNHDDYGAWVDSGTGKIIPVKNKAGHAKAIERMYGVKVGSSAEAYQVGYDHGLVRVGFKGLEMGRQRGMYISGKAEDMKKVAHILLASAMQPDVYVVMLDQVDNPSAHKSFTLPAMRRKLMMTIKGEEE